jgi:uncharacterized RDD family membrane protein YckC
MKFCTKCGQGSAPTMMLCASCGNREFSDTQNVNQKKSPHIRPHHTAPKRVGSSSSSYISSGDPAGHVPRFFAYIIDIIIVTIFCAIVGAILGFLSPTSFSNQSSTELISSSISIVIVTLYFALLHSGSKGATFGKQICNIQLVNENGIIPFWLAVVRAILPTILSIGFVVVLGLLMSPLFIAFDGMGDLNVILLILFSMIFLIVMLSPYWIIFTNDHRKSMIDMICKTRVVKK